LITEKIDSNQSNINLDLHQTDSTDSNNSTDSINPDNTVYGYNIITESWHCTLCGVDMGSHNPRQLCGKYYCENVDSFIIENLLENPN
jgi:ribosomal protein S27AE